MASYLVVWEFRAKKGAVKGFRRVYGPEGDWAKLFRQDRSFMGTELVCDAKDSRRFLTLDHWSSQGAYARFRKKHGAEYAALDEKCERLTEHEVKIGEFRRA